MPGRQTLETGDPQLIDTYRILRRLRQSDQGIVYLAQTAAGDPVALAKLHAGFTVNPDVQARLARGAVPSPDIARFSVARVLDARTDGDGPYIVSEHVDGPTLEAQVHRQGPLAGAELARLAITTGTALLAIHSADLVHLELGPASVLLGPDGPRLTGLGIVPDPPTDRPGHTGATTSAFLAPEQVRGLHGGPPADIFCWACTMVFAATGQSPFTASNITARRHQIVHWEPDLVAVPVPLAWILGRCLAKAPQDRPTAPDLLLLLSALRPELEYEDRAHPPAADGTDDEDGEDDAIPDPRDPAGTHDSPDLVASLQSRTKPHPQPAPVTPHVEPDPGRAGSRSRPATDRPATDRPGHRGRGRPLVVMTSLAVVGCAMTVGIISIHSSREHLRTTAAIRTTPTPSVGSVPAAFAGTWSGLIRQPPGAPSGFPLTVTLTSGSTTGSLSLPSLRCQATLTLTGAQPESRRLTFDERLLADPDGKCATTAKIVVALTPSSTLQLWWQDARNPGNTATGVLIRQ